MKPETITPLAPEHAFCPNPDCAARGRCSEGNIGVHSQKEQRFKCRCHYTKCGSERCGNSTADDGECGAGSNDLRHVNDVGRQYADRDERGPVIVSGAGGSVTMNSSPTSGFTDVAGTSYTLRWTISNAPCTASTNDVILSFADAPTIAKAFSPTTIVAGGTSTVSLTLNNSANPAGLVASFTDTLANMTAVGCPIGGTCGLVAPLSLAANATSLNFTGIALPASGSCVVTFCVRSQGVAHCHASGCARYSA